MNIGDHLFSYAPNDGEVRYRQVRNSVVIYIKKKKKKKKKKKQGGGRIRSPLYNGVRIWTQPPYFVF